MRNSSLFPYCGYLFPFLHGGFSDITGGSFASYFAPESFFALHKING